MTELETLRRQPRVALRLAFSLGKMAKPAVRIKAWLIGAILAVGLSGSFASAAAPEATDRAAIIGGVSVRPAVSAQFSGVAPSPLPPPAHDWWKDLRPADPSARIDMRVDVYPLERGYAVRRTRGGQVDWIYTPRCSSGIALLALRTKSIDRPPITLAPKAAAEGQFTVDILDSELAPAGGQLHWSGGKGSPPASWWDNVVELEYCFTIQQDGPPFVLADNRETIDGRSLTPVAMVAYNDGGISISQPDANGRSMSEPVRSWTVLTVYRAANRWAAKRLTSEKEVSWATSDTCLALTEQAANLGRLLPNGSMSVDGPSVGAVFDKSFNPAEEALLSWFSGPVGAWWRSAAPALKDCWRKDL